HARRDPGPIPTPHASWNLRRIINEPKRGIGAQSESMVAAHAERHNLSFGAALEDLDNVIGLGSRAINALGAFQKMFAGLRELPGGGASAAGILEEALGPPGDGATPRQSPAPQAPS